MSASPDIEATPLPDGDADGAATDDNNIKKEAPQEEEGAVHWMEDPKWSGIIFGTTIACALAGFGLGVSQLTKDEPNLNTPTILVVAVGGILSFVRHSIFHRSDEKRIGWVAKGAKNPDGSRYVNIFLLEVGLANLSWGLLGLLSVVCNWGLALQAASFLVFGMYIGSVAIMMLGMELIKHPQQLAFKQLMAMTSFAVMLLYVGGQGMATATKAK